MILIMIKSTQSLKQITRLAKFTLLSVTLFMVLIPSAQAERIRLDRKQGVVNDELQQMLTTQTAFFSKGVGKIEMGREKDSKSACVVDLFVSPKTVYAVIVSKKGTERAEFYVDHPDDSFKDVLFQNLVKESDMSELSVDKKLSSYKFLVKGNNLTIEVKSQEKVMTCELDLSKAVLLSGETE